MSAPQQSSRQGTGSADSLNWAALAQCESGGNPRAVNPSGTYRGLYQFSLQTWQGVGGQGDPIDASSGEQTYRAKLLYQRSGAGQWPECGRRLFS
ncbi:MAG: transglycosylase family protein [Frankiales bacterium]|nr:transglycosylase family protein [Frankiales bacterium]